MHAPAELDNLLKRVRACTLCTSLPLGPRPILQASPEARILIVGQAPGRITHAKGRPFDDPSGDRLRRWLDVSRDEFYDPSRFALVPMGFCYPGTGKGGDLPPRAECAPAWRADILAMLPNIRMTLVLGEHAHRWHFPDKAGLSLARRVAAWQETWPSIVPMPHPSPRNQRWFRNHPWFETLLLPLLRAEAARILGKTPPEMPSPA